MDATQQANRPAGMAFPALPASDEKPKQRWSEILDETLYIYEGIPNAGHAERRIIGMKDLRPLARRQQAAAIPGIYRDALLATWRDDRANPGAAEVVRDYMRKPDRSLYIWGAVGVGKSWLACAIGNGLLDSGRTVRFQSVPRLFLNLRRTFTLNSISELEILEPLLKSEFLILDELGDGALDGDPRASHFVASRILTLIEERNQGRKPTLMTSNLALEELVRWCGDERIGSRIRGICGESGIVELTGRDLRFDPECMEATAK